MELVEIFPKTIAVAQLQSLTPEVIGQAVEYLDRAGMMSDLDSDGGYTREQQLLEHEMFYHVKHEILAMCKELARSYSHKIEDLAITNSWGNVITAGQSIRYHMHNNSYISGSFYLTGGSTLNLMNTEYPHLFGAFMPQVEGSNHRSLEFVSIPPEPGRIVLFPSGMYHSVSASTDPNRRYSIAFNAIPLGAFGVPTALANIRRP